MQAQSTPLIITTPWITKAAQMDGQRFVYFETSREGVIDRQGEDIAAAALWASKDVFLTQGNLDINHWSWLGNPYGTEARPEFVVGLPKDVKRQGKSIYVKGEIFSNLTPPPEGSAGHWADWFWHSVTQMTPPQRWFPSVFGSIRPGGARLEKRGGKTIRFITAVEWFSVGFAQRAQHGGLPPIETAPVGPLAKATSFLVDIPAALRQGALVMDCETFAKALTVGTPVTDSPAKAGVQALAAESLEGSRRYQRCKGAVVSAILRRKIPAKRQAIAQAFRELGCDEAEAKECAERLLLEAKQKLGGR